MKQANRERGCVIWFTGLSGSGKTTIAHVVEDALVEAGVPVEVLDGDVVRTNLSKGLGFSKEDRDTNILRIGWVAERLAYHGAGVLVSAISPYKEVRDQVRKEIPRFCEVFVKVSVEEATRRDTKGLYEKALKGEIKGFTGVDDPYEAPENPELVVDTEQESPEESASAVVSKLEELGYIKANPPA